MRLNIPALPTLLAFNAGFVDAAGFLALHGLFTSHVTGNFVTLGASIAQGSSGALAKLLALPVFCAAVFTARLLHFRLERQGLPVLSTMLFLKFVLLAVAAVLAVRLGPFPDGDAMPALVTGMMLVMAMAVQNGAHRVHLANEPPSTVMTGTTTQIMLDIADLFHGVPDTVGTATRLRLRRMSISVAAFASGCAAAALIYIAWRGWAFTIPPVLALVGWLRYSFGETVIAPKP